MDCLMMKQTAWIGDEYITGKIRGVAFVFHDLGSIQEKDSPDTVELEWARAGWLVVFPYYGPWCWMNRQARAFADELADAVYANYELADSTPLAVTGCGMGGLAALLYARYAKRPASACMALSPICDLAHQYSERQGAARSIHHAFLGYQEDMEILYKEHSPLAQAAQMPDIPYLIIHGEQNKVVKKAAHSDRLVASLREHGRRVEYLEIPGMGHGTSVPMLVPLKMIQFLARLPQGSQASSRVMPMSPIPAEAGKQ